MAELAQAWITLTVSARGARRDIQRELDGVDGGAAGRRAGQRFSAGAVGATNLTGVEQKMLAVGQRGGEAAGKALAFGLKAGAAAGVAAFATTAKLGADRLLAIDDARGKLKGLGHDAAAQARIMDSALASVKGTAFGLGDAAKISANAIAAGIKPGQELTNYLKLTADAATIAGVGLDEMGRIFNQVRTSGTAMTDDLNQLGDRGLAIFPWLAKEMNVPAAAVKKLASDGKISAEIFERAIRNNIGGAALASGNTVRGSFANMKAAMGRLGAAAEEPSFKRLPATFTAIGTAIDAQVPAARRMAEQFDAKVFDDWIPAAQRAWQELSANPAVRANMTEVSSLVGSIGSTAQQMWPEVQKIGQALGAATGQLGVSTWQLFLTTLEAAAGVANMLVGPLQSIAGFMSSHQGVVTAAVGAWLLFRTVPAIMGRVSGSVSTAATAAQRFGAAATGQNLAGFRASMAGIVGDYRNIGTAAQNSGQQVSRWTQTMRALSNNSTTIRNMGNAFAGAATPVGAFSSALRAGAAPAIAGVQKSARGVIDALGGPWGAAFAAAGIAATLVISQNQKSAQSFQAVQDSIRSTAKARAELTDALLKSRGAITDDVKSQVDDNVSEIEKSLAARASRTGSPLDNIRAEGYGVFNWRSMFGGTDRTQAQAIEEEANKAKSAQKAIDDLKYSKQGLRDVAIGSQSAFEAFARKLEAAGEGGKDAAGKFREMRADFLRQQEAARNLGPGIRELQAAFGAMNDTTATSSDRLKAIKAAMEALSPATSQTAAVGQYAEKVKELVDAAAGIGPVVVNADGTLNGFDANSKKLAESLDALAQSSVAVATNGSIEDIGAMAARNAELFKAWAASTGRPVAEIEKLYSRYGGRAVELSIAMKGAPEAAQSIGLVIAEFARIPGRKSIEMETGQIEAARTQVEGLGFKITEVAGSDGNRVKITADTAEAMQNLANVETVLTKVPRDKPVNISAPGGQATFDLLKGLKVSVDTMPDGNIRITSPMGEATRSLLEQLKIKVETLPDGTIKISQVGMDQVEQRLKAFLNAPAVKTVTVVGTGQSISTDAQGNRGGLPDRAHGAIVPMANGGFRRISKPTTAGIYAGRGAGTIFAERETGGEAYVPLAPGKRKRSTAILGETARLFGLQLIRPGDFFQKFENGGISVDQLKQFASGIQGHKYTWGGGGNTFDADCSGAQSTIANFLTGATGRFATGNQGEALAARGFIMGDPPEGTAAYAIGWVNGGPGGGHTAGTIVDPVGGNVNVEMGGAGGNGQYGGQAAAAASFPNRAYLPLQGQDMNSSGGSGASDDSSSGGSGGGSGSGFGSLGSSIGQALFGSRSGGGTGGSGTSSKTTAATAKQLRDAQDKATDAEKAAAVAKQKVAELEANPKTKASALQAAKDRAEKTQREAAQAKTDLEELKNKGTGTGTKNSTDSSNTSEFQSAGQGFVSGMLQAVGLDGSVFSNPLEWPNFKSGTALANYLGSLAKNVAGNNGSEDMGGLVGGAGAGLGLNIPNLADLAKPQTPQAPVGPGGALPLQGGGVTYDFRGAQLGVSPREMTQKIDSRQNAAFRRQSAAIH
ncbi:tape measure protein [Tsukamurella tyrosinosolvens]|uniref:tape measure protein n=1 Tax=Tsukamurella tyrosinosolvens TaxID=57704 RepID=UPI0009EF5EFB|nr:tape measure protein [Tsukamurella tyrosinosolvens]